MDSDSLQAGVARPTSKETALSTIELTRLRTALARALSIDDVNQLGRETGQVVDGSLISSSCDG